MRQQINRYGDLATAASGVQVSAQNGTVTLTGTVPSAEQRKIIDAVAEGTSGVRAVKDRLSLAAPQTVFTQPDSSISSQIRQALKSQPTVAAAAPNVQVTENNGVVTLTGTVPTEEDKRLIESVAKNTAGVAGINNNLGVALQPTGRTATVPGEIFNLHVEGLSAPDRTLAQRILDGLRTDTVLASLLPTVNINVASGKISLQGTVQNEQQKRAIVSAVQRAAGVDNVADELQVQPPR